MNDVLYLGGGEQGEEAAVGQVFMYPDATSDEVVGLALEGARDTHTLVLPSDDVVDVDLAPLCR